MGVSLSGGALTRVWGGVAGQVDVDPPDRDEGQAKVPHALEHAVVLTRGNLIEPQHLPERITRRRKEPLVADRSYKNPALDVIERAYIMWVLQAEGGNKTRAAEVLGIDPSTLYRKLSRYEESAAPAE